MYPSFYDSSKLISAILHLKGDGRLSLVTANLCPCQYKDIYYPGLGPYRSTPVISVACPCLRACIKNSI